jgi:hypothetical protein
MTQDEAQAFLDTLARHNAQTIGYEADGICLGGWDFTWDLYGHDTASARPTWQACRSWTAPHAQIHLTPTANDATPTPET